MKILDTFQMWAWTGGAVAAMLNGQFLLSAALAVAAINAARILDREDPNP